MRQPCKPLNAKKNERVRTLISVDEAVAIQARLCRHCGRKGVFLDGFCEDCFRGFAALDYIETTSPDDLNKAKAMLLKKLLTPPNTSSPVIHVERWIEKKLGVSFGWLRLFLIAATVELGILSLLHLLIGF